MGSRLGRSTRHDDLNIGEVVADHFFEVSFHLICQDVVLSFWIVSFTVVPHELNMIQGFFDGTVLSAFEFFLHFEEVHGMLDDEGVVIEFQF